MGFAGEKEEERQEGKKRFEKKKKRSVPLGLIIILKPEKHSSLPQGDGRSYCLSVLKNETPYIEPLGCY